MAVPVLLLGPSGSGKTYSLRNLTNESYGLIECEKTMLPFKGGKKFARTKDFNQLSQYVAAYAQKCPIVVVDDFGYCITDLYMRRSWGDEKYRDQFEVYKEIAGRVYRFIEFVNDLPQNVIVYIVMHTDQDTSGNTVPATVGKLLNEKVNLLGMVNVCILSEASGGEYRFIVDGKPPAKSCGAFENGEQPNDLAAIDKGLREFMGWTSDDADDD
jgi:hypothetical protein